MKRSLTRDVVDVLFYSAIFINIAIHQFSDEPVTTKDIYDLLVACFIVLMCIDLKDRVFFEVKQKYLIVPYTVIRDGLGGPFDRKHPSDRHGFTIFTRHWWRGAERLQVEDSFGQKYFYFNEKEEPLKDIIACLEKYGYVPNDISEGSRSND